jgi:predicted DNA-binding protein
MPGVNGIYLNDKRWDVLDALAREAKRTRTQFVKEWLEEMLDEVQGKGVTQ